jgi:hypothetical protein
MNMERDMDADMDINTDMVMDKDTDIYMDMYMDMDMDTEKDRDEHGNGKKTLEIRESVYVSKVIYLYGPYSISSSMPTKK